MNEYNKRELDTQARQAWRERQLGVRDGAKMTGWVIKPCPGGIALIVRGVTDDGRPVFANVAL
jgi:hypothetical protein